MAVPPEVVETLDPLLAVLRAAAEEVAAEQAAILTDPTSAGRRRRLREVAAAIDAEIDRIERAVSGWLTGVLPGVYEAGMAASTFDVSWTQFNRDAVTTLIDDTFDDVLAATSNMRADTKRWIRETTKYLAETGEVEGASTRRLTRRLVEKGAQAARLDGMPAPITSVVYSNGATVRIDQYGEMLFRTKLSTAYNQGVVNRSVEVGVDRFEIFDGHCGLRSHDEPPFANGMIVDAQTALSYPVSHPNCIRSYGARPDLSNDSATSVILPSTTEAQRADQRAAEAARAQRMSSRRRRALRSGRASRSQQPSRSTG